MRWVANNSRTKRLNGSKRKRPGKVINGDWRLDFSIGFIAEALIEWGIFSFKFFDPGTERSFPHVPIRRFTYN
jgi:hypothetical protein